MCGWRMGPACADARDWGDDALAQFHNRPAPGYPELLGRVPVRSPRHVGHRPRCGGRLRVVTLIDDPLVSRRILTHLGLRTDIPEPRPARDPPR